MARFTREVICRPLAGIIARFDKLPHGARYETLTNANKAYNTRVAALMDRELTSEAKSLVAQREARFYYEHLSVMERLGFDLSKFDSETVSAMLLRRGPATADLAPLGASATNAWKLKLLRISDDLNSWSTTARRLSQNGLKRGLLSDKLAYLAFATGNAERIAEASRITNREARHAALKAALSDRSLAKNFSDFTLDGNLLTADKVAQHVDNWLSTPGALTPTMLDDLGTLYGAASQIRKTHLDDFAQTFTREHGRAPTKDEIYEEVGGTFGAYMPRLFHNEWKSGFIDHLVGEVAANHGFEVSLQGIRTDDGFVPFAQLIRNVAGASKNAPLRIGGKVYESAEEAVKALWPNLSPAELASIPNQLRHASQAANDALILRSVPAKLRDAYYQHRSGQLGFEQSFIESIMSYLSSGARAQHLNPLVAPGGAMHDFMIKLNTANAPLAKAFATHIDHMAGRNGQIDKDLIGMMHPLTRVAANALFGFNMTPALMNLSSIFLQGIPYAFSDGFAAGGKDLIHALSMIANPTNRRTFMHVYNESRIGGSFAYGFSTTGAKFGELYERLQDNIRDSDLRGAFVSFKELGISSGEWLAWTESLAVRPFAAALGLAKFYRVNGLHAMEDLSPEMREGAWQAMLSVVDQTTTLQGGINSAPWLQHIRNLPVIGSTASMLTVTPVNLASQFVRDLRRLVAPGAKELRGPAFRRLAVQATFGAVLAGPYWFLPMLRDLEKDPDPGSLKETLIEFANTWESKYSIAGVLHTELGERLNPITGITDRFVPSDHPILTNLLGPLGRPAGDIIGGVAGDPAAKRRALGSLSGFADLPPDSILPSSLQYLMTGGVAFEKMAKAVATYMLPPSQSGFQNVAGLHVPVPTLDGNRVDVNGRPFLSDGSTTSKLRNFVFGGRTVEEAQAAAEGRREQARATRQDSVEQTIRRNILDGNIEGAVRQITDNPDLPIEITGSELQREALNRTLLPQARAVLSDPPEEALRKTMDAARRLEQGNVSGERRKVYMHILLAGLMRNYGS